MLPDMPPCQVRASCSHGHLLKMSDAACASAKMTQAFTSLWMTLLAFMAVLITANGKCCWNPQHVF